MRTRLFLSITSLALLASCASSGPEFVAETPHKDKAIVYIYRQPGLIGAGGTFSIFADGKLLATFWNGQYYEHVANPGTINYAYNSTTYTTVLYYALSKVFNQTQPAGTLMAEAGKEYFMRIDANFGGVRLTPVPDSQGIQELGGLTRITDLPSP